MAAIFFAESRQNFLPSNVSGFCLSFSVALSECIFLITDVGVKATETAGWNKYVEG